MEEASESDDSAEDGLLMGISCNGSEDSDSGVEERAESSTSGDGIATTEGMALGLDRAGCTTIARFEASEPSRNVWLPLSNLGIGAAT